MFLQVEDATPVDSDELTLSVDNAELYIENGSGWLHLIIPVNQPGAFNIELQPYALLDNTRAAGRRVDNGWVMEIAIERSWFPRDKMSFRFLLGVSDAQQVSFTDFRQFSHANVRRTTQSQTYENGLISTGELHLVERTAAPQCTSDVPPATTPTGNAPSPTQVSATTMTLTALFTRIPFTTAKPSTRERPPPPVMPPASFLTAAPQTASANIFRRRRRLTDWTTAR